VTDKSAPPEMINKIRKNSVDVLIAD
jgi:hypothetical protein